MKKLSFCPVCSSSSILYSFDNHDRISNMKGDFSLWQCSSCKSFLLNPQPTAKELAPFYKADYYSFNVSDMNNWARKLELWYMKNILASRSLLKKLLSAIINPLLIEAKIIKNRAMVFVPDGKLLDIGCGSGDFLAKMKHAGMSVEGVDPYAKKELVIPGIKVQCKPLKEARLQKRSFDVITMNHVLEHMPEPNSILQRVNELLKDDGRFVIAVPDANSPIAKHYKEFWPHWDTPRHLVLYNQKSLKNLLLKHGFSVKSTRHVYDKTALAAALANKSLEDGRKSLAIIYRKKIISYILYPLYLFYRLTSRSGEHLEMICMKNPISAKKVNQ